MKFLRLDKKTIKAKKISAGILLVSKQKVFLLHSGGPFYEGKDNGVWTVPKGELNENESLIKGAKREFKEETGIDLSKYLDSNFIKLNAVTIKSGKQVQIFALKTDGKEKYISCNMAKIEYPAKSGKFIEFPECDKGEWFNFEEAKQKVFSYQIPIIEQIEKL